MSREVIVGLDLSLSGLGMCAVPASWDLDWRRVRFETLTYELRKDATIREQAARLRSLARDVRTWVIWAGATRIWIEQLPSYVPAKTMHSLKKNAALHGVLMLELVDQVGIEPAYVDETTARKFLLGRLPQKDRKAHVVEALKAADDPFEDDDQRDAFCCANWGLSELGAPAMANMLFREAAE